MNRILFDASEVDAAGRVTLNDARAIHMRRVLRVSVGDRLRVGIINGLAGEGEVEDITDQGIALRCLCSTQLPEPSIDLILGLPRPKVLKRLLAPLASLGLRRLILTNAEKVERNYFDTHVLDPAFIRERCIEGLTQAGATQLPEVRVVRRLRPFLEDELPDNYPEWNRLLLHPRGGGTIRDVISTAKRGTVLALGPEGGWSEFELDLFERGCQFSRVQFGWHVLRSDVACLAVIGAVIALDDTCCG